MSEPKPRPDPSGPTSRRSFLRTGLALGGAVGTGAFAGRAAAAPDAKNLPPSVPEWSQSLGEGVVSRPYGRPSKFEVDVIRRDVEWLTASR